MTIDRKEIENIIDGIEGWPSHPDVLAPIYLPLRNHTFEIFNYLYHNTELDPKTINTIVKQKMYCSNFQSLVMNDDLQTYSYYEEMTTLFLTLLKQEIKELYRIFSVLSFNEKELLIFSQFVANSSLVLFYMGFADAIPHAAQVTKKCIVEAFKRSSYKYQILQSAIVGWIHDPKFPIKFSWSNLAAHPIIASAIAEFDIYKMSV
jgi:hypothetical protein